MTFLTIDRRSIRVSNHGFTILSTTIKCPLILLLEFGLGQQRLLIVVGSMVEINIKNLIIVTAFQGKLRINGIDLTGQSTVLIGLII